ncbi:reverse transcriptase domain-containing protein [Tanacetum coccineum]
MPPANNGSTEDVQPPVVPVVHHESISEPVNAPVSASMPNQKTSIPFPSRRNDERRREKANDQIEKFYEIFRDLMIQNGNSRKRVTKGKDGYTFLPPAHTGKQFAEEKESKLELYCNGCSKRSSQTFQWQMMPKRSGSHQDKGWKFRKRFSKEGSRQEAGRGQDFKPVRTEKEALMTIDEGQINWVEQTEDEELNHALMAFTVNNEVSMCSKLCLDSYNALQAKYDELQSEFGDQEAALTAHKLAVKKLESQLRASHKQQSSLTEKLNFQANQIFEKDEKLKKYRRIGMKAVKDKDALQKIVDSWSASSKNLWKLIDCGMSSTVKIGLGYGIQSNAEVLGYEEEISRGIFAFRETDAGYYDIPLYSRFKQVEYKGVPHPLSGDYTPREQEDIDDSLYEYGKYGPQPQSPSPTESDASSTVYSTCQSEGGRPLEESPRGNGGQSVNLPPLLAAHLGRGKNGKPLQSSLTSAYGGQALPNNKGGNLPSNGAVLNPVGSVTPSVRWIEDYPLPDGLKMPSHIGSYDGKGALDNFLYLFEGAIRMQKWLMPILGLHEEQRISGFVHGLRTRSLVEHLSTDLPSTYKGLMEKTYTWVEARESVKKSKGNSHYGEGYKKLRATSKDVRKHLRTQIQEVLNSGQLSHLVKGIKKERTKSSDTPRGESKKDKGTAPVEAPILMVNNALVIIEANIFGRNVRRVYMDSRSTCEIIYEHCFEKLNPTIKATKVDLKTPLVGFSRERSWSIGEVPLEITIGDAPLSRTETLNFIIVRSDSSHNMLLGRTTMQRMGIVVSTIHRAIKFHTKKRIGTVLLADETEEGTKKTRKILATNEEKVLSCINAEEKIIVNDKYPDQTVTIRKQLPEHFKKELQNLLKSNADVFAWTHADMTGISRTIMIEGKPFNTEHKLNEYSHVKPVKQNKRGLGPDHNMAACKET